LQICVSGFKENKNTASISNSVGIQVSCDSDITALLASAVGYSNVDYMDLHFTSLHV
jgi:hypothetical protein